MKQLLLTVIFLVSGVVTMLAGIRRDELPANVGGKWQGTGRFLDVGFNSRIGQVPLTMDVQGDTVTGTICGIRWHSMYIERHHTRKKGSSFQIFALMDAPVQQANPRHKTLVLLVTLPGAATMGKLDVDFHLKKRPGFDPGMRVGNVQLSR